MAQLIVFLPLFGFLFCFFFGKIFGFKASQIITTSFLFISAILSWFLFFSYLGEREMEVIYIFNWFTSGNFIVDWSIRLDSLTTTMFIGLPLLLFLINYVYLNKNIENKIL